MTKTKTLPIINAVAFVFMVGINIVSQLIEPTTAQISDKYPTLLTPSGLTFSIWAVIYTLLLFYVAAKLFSKDEYGIGPLFLLSSILNIVWIVTWHYELIFISLVTILGLAIVLYMITQKLKDDRSYIKFSFSIYYAWITIASVVSIFTCLSAINDVDLKSGYVTILSLLALVLICLLAFINRDNIGYLLVCVWALIGIISKHINTYNGAYISIEIACLLVLIALAAMIIIHFVKGRNLTVYE